MIHDQNSRSEEYEQMVKLYPPQVKILILKREILIFFNVPNLSILQYSPL